MLSKDDAFRLSRFTFADIADTAREIRDNSSLHHITYSPNVVIALTHLCQDSCTYCTFAHDDGSEKSPYVSLDHIRSLCQQAVSQKCSEAYFTLGEFPEHRYNSAAAWLRERGYSTTIDYLVDAARTVISEFGILPVVNPGALTDRDIRALKEVSITQEMMLETIAARLCEPGGPHFGSPDKTPARRLASIEAAGRVRVPYSTGMLVGIGDTRHERIEGLIALRDLAQRYGHIQDIVMSKYIGPDTGNDDPELHEEFLWSVAAARLIFEDTVHLSAPLHLSFSSIDQLIAAGIDDLGGIAPAGRDYLAGDQSLPRLENISHEVARAGKRLKARACIYPEFIHKPGYVAEHLVPYIEACTDSQGYLKESPLSGARNRAEIPKQTTSDFIDLTSESESHSTRSERLSNFPTSRPRS